MNYIINVISFNDEEKNIFIYYDSKLINYGITKNNIYKVFLEKNRAYKIKIVSNNQTLITSFYTSINNLCFYISDVIDNNIKVSLFDKNYNNLPIWKGNLKWIVMK